MSSRPAKAYVHDRYPLSPPSHAHRPWVAPVLVGGVALAACAAVALSGKAAGLVPDCPFRAATGLDCPLCGGTRAVQALAGGDLVQALDHNVLVVAALPLLVFAWARWVAGGLGLSLARLRAPARAAPLVAVLVVVFAVARNLDLPGLGWLASG